MNKITTKTKEVMNILKHEIQRLIEELFKEGISINDLFKDNSP